MHSSLCLRKLQIDYNNCVSRVFFDLKRSSFSPNQHVETRGTEFKYFLRELHSLSATGERCGDFKKGNGCVQAQI